MNDRILCLVPHCQHFTRRYGPGAEWICATHWAHVPPGIKRQRSTIRRRLTRRGERGPVIDHKDDLPLTPRAWRLERAIWAKIKRALFTNLT